jgi:hypothetical protein
MANRFGCPDGRTHRSELRGLAARFRVVRARIRVDEVSLFDVGVAPLNQQAGVLPGEERAGNSPSPEVDALARVL